jgi:hypothetical protein
MLMVIDQLQEDVKLMHEMGLDAYRFSISWSRLIPGTLINQSCLRPCLEEFIVVYMCNCRWARSRKPEGVRILQQPCR